jgi:hypothetical protein
MNEQLEMLKRKCQAAEQTWYDSLRESRLWQERTTKCFEEFHAAQLALNTYLEVALTVSQKPE